MSADRSIPEQSCGPCGMGDLDCMNRERMDGFRCCKHCDGHGIAVTDKGRSFMTDAGYPDGDGITMLQLMVQADRARGGT